MANPPQERYVRQRRLGGGSMGEVWLATDTLLNRLVALKYLITKDTFHEDFFLSEARTLASLYHPNITLIYDAMFDPIQGAFYLVMEYVEGESLASLIEHGSGSLPLELVLQVLNGVLQALQYAHEKGIVHRDIKPANVLIQKERVKLTDFGVAGLISRLSQGIDYVVGTPAYMSPEQIDGQGLDGRADLYSLGVMLFELLSGRLPFAYSRETDLFMAHLTEPPPRLREFAPQTPAALERLVGRLLAKNPADRYPSAAAVLEVITSLQARHRYSQGHLKWLEPEGKVFVDRTGELERLAALWTETQTTGQPRLVVVKGKAGIGKSRLLVEFLGRTVIDQGFVVVAGKCAETDVPYSPYAEILATVLNKELAKGATTPEQFNLLLEQIPGLARLLNLSYHAPAKTINPPAPRQPTGAGLWQALSNKMAAPTPLGPASPQWRFYNAVLDMVAQLGPTALFLEDATTLDESSLALTRFLLRQEQLPALLVAACRETDPPSSWLNSLAADEMVMLTVPPLPVNAIQEYLAQTRGGVASEAVAKLVAEQSQGLPLRLEEVIPHLIDSKEIYLEAGEWCYAPKSLEAPSDAFLPKAVFAAFSRQLDSLNDEQRQALMLAALLEKGPEFDFGLWLAALGGEPKRTAAENVLVEAGKKRLVRQVGEQRYTFRSEDIEKALVKSMSQATRQAQHRWLAELLRQQRAEPTLVSYHYEQAGLPGEAVRYLELAGTQAMTDNALGVALECYQHLARLANTSALYQALGRLYAQAGQRAESVQALQQALALAEQAGDVTDQARSLNGLSATLWRYEQYKEAYQQAATVLKMSAVPEAELAAAQANLGMILWLLGRLSEAETWSQKAVQLALQSGAEVVLAEAYYGLGLIYLSQGQLSEAPLALQRALELRQKLADGRGQAECWHALGKVAAERGHFAQALNHLKAAEQGLKQLHRRTGLVAVYTTWGRTLLYQGRPEESLSLLNQALPPTMELGKRSAHLLSDFYLLIAQASLAQGKLNRARSAADNALKLVEGVGNREYMAYAQAVLAQVYAVQGDHALAQSWYQQALSLFEQVGCRPGLVRTQGAYAPFLRQQGQSAEAAKLEQAARAEATRMGLYWPGVG
jgi:predicted ATPase